MINKLAKQQNFKNYSKKDVIFIYIRNNINKERVEICGNFMINLTNLLVNNFLGFDSFETKDELDGYINWCFNKNSELFENIYNFNFKNKKELKEYCKTYSEEILKNSENKNIISKSTSYIKEHFNLHTKKNEEQLESFITIYIKFYKE